MQKISRLQGDEWLPYSHAPIYAITSMKGGKRLQAGIPAGDPSIFTRLVSCLEPTYFLLYIFHTPRGEGAAGRYQSPPISLEEFREFIDRFATYLTADSRFDLWGHSPTDNSTVVWDRHNLLYAYGKVDRLAAELNALGFTHGDARISYPHVHHYRAECDADATAALAHFSWIHSALQETDEQ